MTLDRVRLICLRSTALLCLLASCACASTGWDPFLDTLQAKTLRYFLDVTPRETGLTPDRWPTPAPASVAAIGFALTCYPIAAERGLISRAEAVNKVTVAFRMLRALPQSAASEDVAGYRGFYYHFLKAESGMRAWNCELSSIDTGLLMAGILFCQSYFDRENEDEADLRRGADSLYRRVDWIWFATDRRGLATGWYPDRGFNEHTWTGYNEALILYILALGSPTHPLPDWYMHTWYSTYQWGTFYGQEHVGFGPLFGHQYSHCWIDFRGIRDRAMWGRGIDYFENSRRATYAQRAYAIENLQGYRGYGPDFWGLTACDGPGDTIRVIDGITRRFYSYRAREATFSWVEDDGTVSPTAAGGSIAFAPEIALPALKHMRQLPLPGLWGKYGFADAVNPTYVTSATGSKGWVGRDYISIDQGPIAIMIENLRSGLVWETMMRNPYIVAGLRRAGFSGGWLDRIKTD